MFTARIFLSLGLTVLVGSKGWAESFTFVTAAGLAGNGPGIGLTGDGSNNLARFKAPAGLCLDSANNVYVADANAIRRMAQVGTNWVVTTLAGVAGQHGTLDATNADARFDTPQGLAVDATGNLFVADTLNNAIRKISPSGTNWIATTIAGTAGRSYAGSVDGTNNAARFDHPYGIAMDAGGNLYVADTYNSTIRKISLIGTDWVVTTLAGLAATNGTADGTNTSARFDGPTGLVVDGATNLYVTDFNNHTIRKLTASGTNWIVTTIAGLASVPGSADGTNKFARFYLPQSICLDSIGYLYLSEAGNNTIRKLRPTGTNWVTATVAGSAGIVGSADGTGSSALFSDPFGLGMDPSGRLFAVDALNLTVRSGHVAIMLDVRSAGSELRLSWPLAATNYILESSASLNGLGGWAPITSGILASGDTYVLNTNSVGSCSFFRLHKP